MASQRRKTTATPPARAAVKAAEPFTSADATMGPLGASKVVRAVCGVKRGFGLAWLPLAAACSTPAGPGGGTAPAAAPSDTIGLFFASDAGAADLDAPIGLSCADASASFADAVAPILTSCAGGELCHGFPPSAYLRAALVGAPSADGCEAGVLVAPGDLQGSYLLHKLTGIGMCPGTMRMPPGGVLAPRDIQAIADWICAGAPAD